MCVGVVKEDMGLKLISFIPHILNRQDSGPGGDKKRRKHVVAREGKEVMLTCSPFNATSFIQVRLLNIQV